MLQYFESDAARDIASAPEFNAPFQAAACSFARYGKILRIARDTEQDLRNCARLEQFIVGQDAAPDSRLASPESTWKFLLASLRKGDKESALLCLTVDSSEMFEAMFLGMSAEQRREMADSFTSFQPPEKMSDTFQEVAIVRGDRATIAEFVLVHGNCKLNQL